MTGLSENPIHGSAEKHFAVIDNVKPNVQSKDKDLQTGQNLDSKSATPCTTSGLLHVNRAAK